jgi:mycobactin peptide synthetase MbtE
MVFEHPAIHDLAATVDKADSVLEDSDAHHEPMAASGLSADELAAVTSMFAASQDEKP